MVGSIKGGMSTEFVLIGEKCTAPCLQGVSTDVLYILYN